MLNWFVVSFCGIMVLHCFVMGLCKIHLVMDWFSRDLMVHWLVGSLVMGKDRVNRC